MLSRIPSMIGTSIVLLLAFTFVSTLMAGSGTWTSCQNPNCATDPPEPPIGGAKCKVSQYGDVCYGYVQWGCGCVTTEHQHLAIWACDCKGNY